MSFSRSIFHRRPGASCQAAQNSSLHPRRSRVGSLGKRALLALLDVVAKTSDVRKFCKLVRSEQRNSVGSLYAKAIGLVGGDAAIELFECYEGGGKRKAPLSVVNSTLAVLARHGKADEVVNIFERLAAGQVDVYSYTHVMSAHGKCGRVESCLDYLQKMEDDNFKPDLVAYNTALSALGRAAKPVEAESLLDKMTAANVTPSIRSYNALLLAHERSGDVSACLSLLEKLRNEGIANVASFSTVMSACARAGKWEAALQLLTDLQLAQDDKSRDGASKDGIKVDKIAFSACITACEKGGRWKEALRILQMAKSAGVVLDTISYSAAISACEKCGQWEAAVDLLQQLKEAGLRPDTIAYNATLAAVATAGEWKVATKLLADMKDERVKCTAVTLNAAVRACERSGQYQHAINLLTRYGGNTCSVDSSSKASKYGSSSTGRSPSYKTVREHSTGEWREAMANRLERLMSGVVVANVGHEPFVPSTSSCQPIGIADGVNLSVENSLARLKATSLEKLAMRDQLLVLRKIMEGSDDERLRKANVLPFGSLLAGICSTGGDLDVCLLWRRDYLEESWGAGEGRVRDEMRHLRQRVLLSFRDALAQSSFSDALKVESCGLGGRMPVLTLTNAEGLKIDLTVQNLSGLRKSRLLRAYCSLDPKIADVSIWVKRWAKLNGVAGSTHGYLCGYAWTLCVIYFWQVHFSIPTLLETPLSSADHKYTPTKLPVAELIARFFTFYASEFDWRHECASVRLGVRSARVVKDKSFRAKMQHVQNLSGASSKVIDGLSNDGFSLEDPIDVDWDLGAILSSERVGHMKNQLAAEVDLWKLDTPSLLTCQIQN